MDRQQKLNKKKKQKNHICAYGPVLHTMRIIHHASLSYATSVLNLAVAKRIVLNMVRKEKEKYPKLSANLKRLMASLDIEYRTFVFDLNFKS